jgi:hypothetical protein
MAELTDAPAPLDAKETAQLTEFARACKAAARAVVLYPPGHPAIAATLGRITAITSPPALEAPLKLRVLPDGLLLDDRTPARADAALGELASLLHSHLIGEMTIQPGGDLDAWRTFLLLLGRTPESVRGDGGIARVWTTMVRRGAARAGGRRSGRVAAHRRQLPAGQRVRSRRDGYSGTDGHRRRWRTAGEPGGVARRQG